MKNKLIDNHKRQKDGLPTWFIATVVCSLIFGITLGVCIFLGVFDNFNVGNLFNTNTTSIQTEKKEYEEKKFVIAVGDKEFSFPSTVGDFREIGFIIDSVSREEKTGKYYVKLLLNQSTFFTCEVNALYKEDVTKAETMITDFTVSYDDNNKQISINGIGNDTTSEEIREILEEPEYYAKSEEGNETFIYFDMNKDGKSSYELLISFKDEKISYMTIKNCE